MSTKERSSILHTVSAFTDTLGAQSRGARTSLQGKAKDIQDDDENEEGAIFVVGKGGTTDARNHDFHSELAIIAQSSVKQQRCANNLDNRYGYFLDTSMTMINDTHANLSFSLYPLEFLSFKSLETNTQIRY